MIEGFLLGFAALCIISGLTLLAVAIAVFLGDSKKRGGGGE